MISLWVVAMIVGTTEPSEVIGLSRENWKPASKARQARVECEFRLEIRRDDPALGNIYFPNSSQPRKGVAEKSWKSGPQTMWLEDLVRVGDRYRFRVDFRTSDGSEAPAGFDRMVLFDGTSSWVKTAKKRLVLRYDGVVPQSGISMDYYGDIIGHPWLKGKATRNTAGDIEEKYDLYDLDPTRYSIIGSENVAGEDCVVLQRAGLDKLWLATRRGGEVAKREWSWTDGGPIKRRITNTDFREVSEDLWMPWKGSMEIFPKNPKNKNDLVGVLRYNILKITIDINDNLLKPDFPVGTVVYDVVRGDQFEFGREKEQMDTAVAKAAGYGPAFRRTPWWRRTSVIVLALLSGIIGVVLALRIRNGG